MTAPTFTTRPATEQLHHYAGRHCSVNFLIRGLLDEGATSTTRFDKQAKALGEWLRARVLDVPEHLWTGSDGLSGTGRYDDR